MKLTRWDTNQVIFELECNSWEELLKGALEAKISFYRADFRGSDFRGSNFRYSNFSDSDFSNSDFSDSNFSDSDFSNSDFSDSNFSDSDFSDSEFSDSEFSDSNFRGSKHQYKIGNMREWHSMQLDTYMIVFNKHILAIGCKQFKIKEWESFTDEEITDMDSGALEWWKKWKDFIFKAIELCEKD